MRTADGLAPPLRAKTWGTLIGLLAVHAADVPSLPLPDAATPAFPGFNLFSHTLARGVLVPVYKA